MPRSPARSAGSELRSGGGKTTSPGRHSAAQGGSALTQGALGTSVGEDEPSPIPAKTSGVSLTDARRGPIP